MKQVSVSDWVQIGATLALIIGIGLVIYELRQTREITQAQLVSEGYASEADRRIALWGENPADVLAKACETPDMLTSGDAVVLRNYFGGLLTPYYRLYEVGRTGDFYADHDWRPDVRWRFSMIFETHIGRYWWKRVQSSYPEELRAVGNAILAEVGGVDCLDFVHGYKTSLKEVKQQGSR